MKFCIVGTGRCGTRLLRSMLNDHPDIFVFNETHWMPELYNRFGTMATTTREMLDVIARTRHVNGEAVTQFDHQEFLAEIGNPRTTDVAHLCNSLGMFHARKNGKSVWADKTPDYGYFSSVLQVYWPDCKIIHLIREGTAVARSMANHPGYQALASMKQVFWCPMALDYVGKKTKFPLQPMHAYAELWYHRLVRARNEATRLKPGTYLEIRHEDILENPSDQMSKLARFVDLDLDRAWLNNTATAIDLRKVKKDAPTGILNHFSDRHIELLGELGYATKEV